MKAKRGSQQRPSILPKAIVALVSVIGLGLAYVWGTSDVGEAADWAQLASIPLAAAALLPLVITARRRSGRQMPVPTNEQLDRSQQVLARLVHEQWRREILARQLDDPAPLSAEWRLTRLPVMDHSDHLATPRRTSSLRFRRLPQRALLKSHTDDIADTVKQFRTLNRRRLVIIGDPGMGKTTFAVLLLRHLLENPLPDEPIPVMVTMSGWNPDVTTFPEWFAARLAETYPMLRTEDLGPNAPHALVMEHRVMPVLDGLDELPEPLRPKVINALNASLTHADALILTCRTNEYRTAISALDGDPLTSGAVIEPLPLRPADIARYLRRCLPPRPTGSWPILLSTLTRDKRAPVTQALRTPLALWLLRKVYIDTRTDPAPLLAPASFTTDEQVMDHLLDHLAHALITTRSPSRNLHHSWKPEEAQVWLSFLAHHLYATNTTDLSWWQLRTALPQRTVKLTAALVGGSAFALAGGLAALIAGGPVFGVAGALVSGLAVGLVFAFSDQRSDTFSNIHRPLLGRATRFVREVAVGVVLGIVGGFAAGGAFGLGAGLLLGFVAGPMFWFGSGVAGGLAGGLVGGLMSGLLIGGAGWRLDAMSPQSDSFAEAFWRRRWMCLLGHSLVGGFVSGPVVGLTIMIAVGINSGLQLGLVFGLSAGLIFGFSTPYESVSSRGGLVYSTSSHPRLRNRFRTVFRTLTCWLILDIAGSLLTGAFLGPADEFGFGFSQTLAQRFVFGLAGGVSAGMVFGLAAGFLLRLAGWSSVPHSGTWATKPSFADLRLRGRTRLLAHHLLSWLAVGTVGGTAFGLTIGWTGGVTFGIISGLVIGLVFALVGGLTEWAKNPQAHDTPLTPSRSLRHDTQMTFLESLAAGLVGTLAGALAVAFTGGVVNRIQAGLIGGFAIGAAAWLAAWLASSSGNYFITVGHLSLRGRTPRRLMRFLEDAHQLGVLRQSGSVYQFSHAKLQERLADVHLEREKSRQNAGASR